MGWHRGMGILPHTPGCEYKKHIGSFLSHQAKACSRCQTGTFTTTNNSTTANGSETTTTSVSAAFTTSVTPCSPVRSWRCRRVAKVSRQNETRTCFRLTGDVGLIVEVSDSSLAEDRAMVRAYGRAGIPIYWIVNLVDRQI